MFFIWHNFFVRRIAVKYMYIIKNRHFVLSQSSTPAVGASTPAGGLVPGYSVHHGVCDYRCLMHCKGTCTEPPTSTRAVGASTPAGGLVRGYSVHHGVCDYRCLMHCKGSCTEPPTSMCTSNRSESTPASARGINHVRIFALVYCTRFEFLFRACCHNKDESFNCTYLTFQQALPIRSAACVCNFVCSIYEYLLLFSAPILSFFVYECC